MSKAAEVPSIGENNHLLVDNLLPKILNVDIL
jgi:hypothetical protein